jgi:hypothetical protein
MRIAILSAVDAMRRLRRAEYVRGQVVLSQPGFLRAGIGRVVVILRRGSIASYSSDARRKAALIGSGVLRGAMLGLLLV